VPGLFQLLALLLGLDGEGRVLVTTLGLKLLEGLLQLLDLVVPVKGVVS